MQRGIGASADGPAARRTPTASAAGASPRTATAAPSAATASRHRVQRLHHTVCAGV